MTMNPPQTNHFDRSKPFYPIVMGYLVQLAGFKQLAYSATLRQLVGLVGAVSPGGADAAPTLSPQVMAIPEVSTAFKLITEELAKPLQLRSAFQGTPIVVDINELAWEAASNSPYLGSRLMLAAGHVLVLAHEVSKNRDWHNTDPLWDFLRHCRNAVAHGGSFHFQNGEPVRRACWGPFNLTTALQDTWLFNSADRVGLLWPGDPIRLLWDIEQAYPAMAA